MNLKILKQTENRMFNRKELLLETSFSGPTPSNSQINKSITELTKSPADLIVIDNIHQLYGTTKAKIYAKIYTSNEDLKKVEVINKKPKKTEEKK